MGLTVTGLFDVTPFTPWSTLPLPLAKTAVSVALPPAEILVGFATKLVIVGTATTTTVVCAVTIKPKEFVTVSVYVVVAVGLTVTGELLVTAFTPWSTLAVPYSKTAVSAVDPPKVIVGSAAAKLVIEGAGTTVTVVLEVTVAPAALVTVSV